MVADPNNSRFKQVVDRDGKKIGQVQPMSGGSSFQASVLCKREGRKKPRCSRYRGWGASAGEDPRMVYLVLAHWCLRGATCPDAKARVALKRFGGVSSLGGRIAVVLISSIGKGGCRGHMNVRLRR